MDGVYILQEESSHVYPTYAVDGRYIWVGYDETDDCSQWAWMFTSADQDPPMVVSATHPLAGNPLSWPEWNNIHTTVEISSWLWSRGYLSIMDQLICLSKETLQMKSFESDNAMFCDSKKDCLGGADEKGCPFYTGPTTLYALSVTGGIVLAVLLIIGCVYLGHSLKQCLNPAGPVVTCWHRVVSIIRSMMIEKSESAIHHHERPKYETGDTIITWWLGSSSDKDGSRQSDMVAQYRTLIGEEVYILVSTAFLLIKSPEERSNFSLFVKKNEKELHGSYDRIQSSLNMLNSMKTGFPSRYYANTVYFLSGHYNGGDYNRQLTWSSFKMMKWTGLKWYRFMIFIIINIGKIFTFTLDIVQDSFFFYFLHFMAGDIKGIPFISCLTYFDLSTIVFAQFFIGLFWLVKQFKIQSKSFWVGLFISPFIAPFVPYVYMTKRAIDDNKTSRIVDDWLDQIHNEDAPAESPSEIYWKYKATIEEGKNIKQTDITNHQIICNFENLPQIVLLMSFISVNLFNKDGDSEIELNIVPKGQFEDTYIYWVPFSLSLFLSCYNAMSSFIESTNVMKLDQPGLAPKLLLTISFALQIVSRIGPTTVICIMKIYADAKSAVSTSPNSDYDIPLHIVFCMLLLPVVIRWVGTLCIYKWFASTETRQRYDDLGGFFSRFVHICTNIFMINPVRSDNEEDSAPRKKEHFFLFGLSFLDFIFYLCFWFVFSLPAPCMYPFLMLLLILPIAGSLLGGFFLWRYYQKTILHRTKGSG